MAWLCSARRGIVYRPRADLSRKIVLRVWRARAASYRPSRSKIALSRLASRWKLRVSWRWEPMGWGVQAGAWQQESPSVGQGEAPLRRSRSEPKQRRPGVQDQQVKLATGPASQPISVPARTRPASAAGRSRSRSPDAAAIIAMPGGAPAPARRRSGRHSRQSRPLRTRGSPRCLREFRRRFRRIARAGPRLAANGVCLLRYLDPCFCVRCGDWLRSVEMRSWDDRSTGSDGCLTLCIRWRVRRGRPICCGRESRILGRH